MSLQFQAKQFSTGAEVLMHRQRVKDRIWSARPHIKRVEPVVPEPVVVEPPAPFVPAVPSAKVTKTVWKDRTAFSAHVDAYRVYKVMYGGTPAKVYIARRCHEMGVQLKDLRTSSRRRHLVRTRFQLMWEIKHKFGMSQTEIGRMFGKDHTTVLHGVRHIQTLIDAGEMENPLAGDCEGLEGGCR